MTVPKEKRGLLVGKSGEKLNTLLRTTSMSLPFQRTLINLLDTKIFVPPASEKSDQIIIEGDPREVAHAKREIATLLKSVQHTGTKVKLLLRYKELIQFRWQ